MGRYKAKLGFSFGRIPTQVNLTGRYSGLDPKSDDRLRSAVIVSLLQLIRWRENARTHEPHRFGMVDMPTVNDALVQLNRYMASRPLVEQTSRSMATAG